MERYFTVREIAEIIGVTKPTVQKAINTLGIEADKEDSRNSRYYSEEKTIEIIKSIKPSFDVADLAQNTAKIGAKPQNELQSEPQNLAQSTANTAKFSANPPNEPQNLAQSTAKPQNNTEIIESIVSTLQEQLAIKDRQLKALEEQLTIKDKQIQDYSNRLAEAMQLTKGQQYIAAADKVSKLTAEQTEQEEETVIYTNDDIKEHPTEKKKGFFKRLFNK